MTCSSASSGVPSTQLQCTIFIILIHIIFISNSITQAIQCLPDIPPMQGGVVMYVHKYVELETKILILFLSAVA